MLHFYTKIIVLINIIQYYKMFTSSPSFSSGFLRYGYEFGHSDLKMIKNFSFKQSKEDCWKKNNSGIKGPSYVNLKIEYTYIPRNSQYTYNRTMYRNEIHKANNNNCIDHNILYITYKRIIVMCQCIEHSKCNTFLKKRKLQIVNEHWFELFSQPVLQS